jgi:hypothetical protein
MNIFRIPVVLGSALFAGCVSITVGSDFDPGTDFTKHTTFAWETVEQTTTGDPRLDDNPFFDSRVRSAVERQLSLRGLDPAPAENADLMLHYHMFVEHRERINVDAIDRELDEARGYSIFNRNVDVEVYVNEYDEGTLMIDFADAADKHIMWRGWAKLVVTDVIDDRERLDSRIGQAVEKIIALYPAG